MADSSKYVTNKEVQDFIPALKDSPVTSGSPQDLIIKAVDAVIDQYLAKTFRIVLVSQTIEFEDIHVETGEICWDGIVTMPRRDIFLRYRPVTEFTSLRMVLSRNPTDGKPLDTSIIARETYYVDMDTGIVSLLAPIINSVYPYVMTSWPQGVAILQASYKAGVDIVTSSDTALNALKLAELQIIARIFAFQNRQSHHVSSVSADGAGQTNFLRVTLSNEDKLFLNALAGLVLE